MKKRELERGDVVQINPKDPVFGGSFGFVDEPLGFGATIMVTVPGRKGFAPYRASFEDIEFIGKAVWYT